MRLTTLESDLRRLVIDRLIAARSANAPEALETSIAQWRDLDKKQNVPGGTAKA